jgi:hypothetical protein
MQDEFTKPRYLNLLFAHLDACKDVCDHFGITTSLVPYKPKGSTKVTGFTVNSFRNPQSNLQNTYSSAPTATTERGKATEGKEEFEFSYDPFWDDGTDFAALYDGIDDEHIVPDKYPAIENKIPDSDDVVIDISKKWVAAMMSDMGVCPFTQGADKAGLPVGEVFYAVDRSSGFEDMYARYWKEVVRVEQNNEKDVSTTLLITPEFCMDNLELFETFTNTLTQPLTALGIEDLIQLVFFHPVWSFRDGNARTTVEGQAANYARRSPWPMINILRTSQVRAAQKGIPTGLVYKQNEKTLSTIGVDKLETMLRLRDWADTAEHKVNRREVDALKIAQDFQTLGKVSEADTSLQHDSTPAANKVNRKQVEEGNLVNVLLEALEKRLGKGGTADANLPILSGPETSAAAMATDVLIEELDTLIVSKTSSAAVGPTVAVSPPKWSPGAAQPVSPWSNNAGIRTGSSATPPDEIAQARQARIDAARKLLLEDVTQSGDQEQAARATGRRDPMQDVMFGRGGISGRNLDEEMFPEGMNPDSFY